MYELITYTVTSVEKGHQKYRSNKVDLWASGLYLEVTLIYWIHEMLLKSGLYLHNGFYLQVAFNTILTVYTYCELII
jgi:hypothetical protein